MEEKAGKVLRMARPAAWWARRAALHYRSGNRRQAEVLYRQAVALTPDSVPLKLAYARVLQDMGRWEASNHQAFAALALDPRNVSTISLIAYNLMALGHLEEAADAFSHVLYAQGEGMDEACAGQLDRLEAMLTPPAETAARYRILVDYAAEDLAAGEWDAVAYALERACDIPRGDERCHTLRALYYKALEQPGLAVQEAVAACRLAPQSSRTWCVLAELSGAMGKHKQAYAALLLAAARALTAADEQYVCQTAVNLKLYAVPLPLLARAGNRVQALYNKGVLLLLAGKTQDALQALEQCRDLDPQDVPSRYLRRTAQEIAALPAAQAQAAAKGLRLYPALSDRDSEACYRAFMEPLAGGMEAFALRLQSDESYYRLALYQAHNPHTDISGLLEQGFPFLSENFTVRMMREILLQPDGGFAEKQLAIRVLTQDKPQPFVLWHGGRLSFIKPGSGGQTAAELRLKELLLGRAGLDPRLTTYALGLFHRLPQRIRVRLSGERGGSLWAAVRLHYALYAAPGAITPAFPRVRHVKRLTRMLARFAPAQRQAAPRLWLSANREENP